MQPSLKVSNEIADLSLLREVEVTMVTTTTEDVPQTTRVSVESLSNGRDVAVECEIPAKVKQVRIEVTAKLPRMTTIS